MFDHEPIIGIDLGTTNSVVAILESLEPVVIPNREGGLKTPSIVAFEADGTISVGELARRQAATRPERTISSAKRLIGHYFSEIGAAEMRLPYRLEATSNDEIEIVVGDRRLRPQDISAEVLKKLKRDAEDHLDCEVKQAIITVPAYFDDRQRNATKEAGRLAGLEVLRLVNEPTAAAMAYGLGKGKGGLTAVYDFGGGTFDLTLLDINDRTFEVIATEGDSHLGGDDLDALLVQRIVDEFFERHGVDLTESPATLIRLRESCEKAKCELSTVRQTTISLPFLTQINNEPVHFERPFTRTEFEELIEPLIERSVKICANALSAARIDTKNIKRIILVGGTTRIPLVGQMVEEFFQQQPYRGVNPDEIVAMGAAVQAGVLAGDLDEVVLLDVTPHSLGIETRDDGYSKIVERNTTIPIKAAKTFTTTEQDQEFVNIHVLQGEAKHASENLSLGNFLLRGIDPSPAGHPRIRVAFQINADGILEITAQDLSSGSEQGLTITHAYLSEEERKARELAQRKRGRSNRKKTGSRRRRGATSSSGGERRPLGIVSPATGTFPSVEADEGTPAPSPERPNFPRYASSPSGASFAVIDDSTPFEGLPTESIHLEGPNMGFDLEKTIDEPADAIEASPTPTPRHIDSHPGGSFDLSAPDSVINALDPTDWVGDTPSPDIPPRPIASPATPSPAAKAAAARVSMCPEGEMGEAIELAFKLADEDADGPTAVETFRTVESRLEELARVYPQDPRLHRYLAKMYALRGDAEKALRQAREAGVSPAVDAATQGTLLAMLAKRFPSHTGIRRARAAQYRVSGEFSAAIKELEHILTAESGDPSLLGQLEDAYLGLLEQNYSTSQELKLVKVLLRQNKIDDAITRLQRIVEDPNYRVRAQKVLGFCFWQKQMYYPAYQQFRNLTVSEELKDILGRLAGDLEATGDSLRALEVLEFLAERDPGNESVEHRMASLRARNSEEMGERRPVTSSGIGLGPKTPTASDALRGSRFVILEELNRGSMGVVYKARDTALDEIVALKVLNDFLGSDPMAVERFKREARAAKRLTHPRIVRINDLFEVGDKKLISMEFIDGDDLKRILMRKKKFDAAEFRSLVLQICEGLDYAHRRGVVHRDIKPANIMLTSKNSEVKITDLGIVKNLQSEDMTTGSRILGTPLYMAPEQIEGKGIDARTDIYALGIMLYEIVAGTPPFCDGNIEYQHIHSEPPPLPSEVDPTLAAIILKMVAKKKDDRYPSVAALSEAIAAL